MRDEPAPEQPTLRCPDCRAEVPFDLPEPGAATRLTCRCGWSITVSVG